MLFESLVGGYFEQRFFKMYKAISLPLGKTDYETLYRMHSIDALRHEEAGNWVNVQICEARAELAAAYAGRFDDSAGDVPEPGQPQ